MIGRRQSKKVRGVFERPPGSGHWYVVFYVNGRRVRQAAGSKSEAVALYQLRKAQVREGRLPECRKDRLFEQFVRDYLDGERVRARSFVTMQRHGRRWCERFKGKPLRSILPLDVEKWVIRRTREVSPASVNRELSFLRRVFNVALTNGLVDRNPVKGVKFLR